MRADRSIQRRSEQPGELRQIAKTPHDVVVRATDPNRPDGRLAAEHRVDTKRTRFAHENVHQARFAVTALEFRR
jgi:hypothetical protein